MSQLDIQPKGIGDFGVLARQLLGHLLSQLDIQPKGIGD